jgi:hypothetical protein
LGGFDPGDQRRGFVLGAQRGHGQGGGQERIKTPRINFDDNASQPGSRNDSYCLWFAFYNFCRIHSTIRVTPAMEAGIADHVWDLKEILALTRYLKK